MNVSGERTFKAPRATVWRVLNDPASMAQTMTCLRAAAAARVTPRMARLSASVPPLVKTISAAEALMSAATWRRAASKRCFAACPKWWMLDALPYTCPRQDTAVSRTSGSTGVVAL